MAAVWTPLGIGLPPVLHHGSAEMKERVARPVISGDKLICLAITEPTHGSDVAGIQTTAVRDGDFFVVNGQKKFITGGGYADFFVTLVRTGETGMGGLSVLLLERTMPGITARRIKTQVWELCGCSFVSFSPLLAGRAGGPATRRTCCSRTCACRQRI